MNLLQRARLSVRHDDGWHAYAGNQYWGQPLTSWQPDREGIGSDFAKLVSGALKANAIVWACERIRTALFSEARFQWRQMNNGRPGDLFGNADLGILERPWPGGTTGDLLARMLLDADFGGTAFVARERDDPDRLKRMRPDWVTIVLGSDDDPTEANKAMDADIVGFLYHRGGVGADGDPKVLLPDEVAHFAPNPDPLAAYRGMSWLSPITKEIDADIAATSHKLMFFQNGATPQMVVIPPAGVTQETLAAAVRQLEQRHDGWRNAYRTMYVSPGSTVSVVGKDLAQLDFKATQGAGETRIAAAAGVHPVVAALSEGMQGSSLNAGNFNSAKRMVAEDTLRPLWRAVCSSLQSLLPQPPGGYAELWYDERDIAFLQEDRKDAADIQRIKAQTIAELVREGFDPATVIAAVEAEDNTLLKHSGMLSVQLQTPGTQPALNGNGQQPALTGAP